MPDTFICDAVRTPIGRYGGESALCTICVGIGQGIAMIIEEA